MNSTDESSGFIYTSLSISKSNGLGLLFVNDAGDAKTTDISIPSSVLSSTNELYFIYGLNDYYMSLDEISGIRTAEITSADGNKVSGSVYGYTTLDKDLLVVKNSAGETLTVSDVVVSGNEYTITLANGDLKKIPYSVSYDKITVSASVTPEVIDEAFLYKENDLGVTVKGSTATFKCWAPLASKVNLLIFADSNSLSTVTDTIPMTRDESNNAVFVAADVNFGSNKYYKYEITNGTSTKKVCDIWNGVASADSVASQICTIDDVSATPASWETEYFNPFNGDYTDAVIYEMHVRDWSRAVVSDSTGKFLDIANSEEIINHLKDIGVTHVQILPMFDYSQTNDDDSYNWGYNPYNYNVPEGRYVSKDYVDGTQAVKEMRQMIKALHDAGIAVNMDVVYNHTSGTQSGSLYDMTVPKYFYRLKDGNYTNGSGCGNEVATNNAMVRKFVIESLKHWMNDYHINGFRFDLMGCHETSTMKAIYEELVKIDPKVMVYGEPWTGGDSSVSGGCNKKNINSCAPSTTIVGVACFNDDIRNAIKGAEFGGFGLGQVQGSFKDDSINVGLMGSLNTAKSGSESGFAYLLGRSINYVECHDNYTLADKLCYSTVGSSILQKDNIVDKFVGYDSLSSANKDLVRAQDKLCAAYIFLAQGTPFINGGQEFMRTKKGNPDSYSSDTKGGKFWSKTEIDECNTIDLSYKTKFADVYNTYKGLIALRKENSDAFGANTSAKAETVKTGVTKYTTRDFLVYFNASDSAEAITTTGYSKVVDVTSGTPTVDSTLPSSVAAKSFVILKK